MRFPVKSNRNLTSIPNVMCYVFHIDLRLRMSEKFSKWNDACFTNKNKRQWNYFLFLEMTNNKKETTEREKKKLK